MSLSIWFWILFVLALLLHGTVVLRGDPTTRVWSGGASLLLWLLLFIIGLSLYGSPITGTGAASRSEHVTRW